MLLRLLLTAILVQDPCASMSSQGYTPKLPALVKVGDAFYSIRYGCPSTVYGMTWAKKHVICLNPNMDAPKFREVLTHELLHAARNEAGYPLDQKSTEEDIINTAAPIFAVMLRKNPEVVELLTK